MVQFDFLTEDYHPVTGTIWLSMTALGDWMKQNRVTFPTNQEKDVV